MHLREYKDQEKVFLQNEPAGALYILSTGEVEASIDHFGNGEKLFTIPSGQSFGYEALFSQSRRIYNATVSSEEASIYAIASVHLQDVLSHHPQIEAQVMSNLSSLYKQYIYNLFSYYSRNTGFFELSQVKSDI